jgi:hypothetical protein
LVKVFKNLEGGWQLERVIAPGGVIVGLAEFKPLSKSQYYYKEQGRLTLDDGRLIEDVSRAYDYRLESDVIKIYYADGPDNGKLFQTLEFSGETKAIAEHLCGDDLYKSEYEFYLPESFTIRHQVKGPKKDYISETKYSKRV